MLFETMEDFRSALDGVLEVHNDEVRIIDQARFRNRTIDQLVYNAVFQPYDDWREFIHWLIRESAAVMEVHPASLYSFYEAEGKGLIPRMTVPACNLRTLSYDLARPCFRAAHQQNAGPLLFQLSQLEFAFTEQSPSEFASCVLAAAIKEGHVGPVFLQVDRLSGDEASMREHELDIAKSFIDESINAGFYNFILEATRLFEPDRPTESEQLRACVDATALLGAYIRECQPAGVTICLGGEVPRLVEDNFQAELARAYMDEFLTAVRTRQPQAEGLSKVSLGTHSEVYQESQGASQVQEDFAAVNDLGEILRRGYHLAGSVMHDVSGLPDELLDKLAQSGICEVHLASRIQNLVLDHPQFPTDLKEEMYTRLDNMSREINAAHDAEYYRAKRKYALFAFKRALWDMPTEVREAIGADLEAEMADRIGRLGLINSERPMLDNMRIQRVHPEVPKGGLHPTAEKKLHFLLTPTRQPPVPGTEQAGHRESRSHGRP
jgi:fructose/tagatose bisphosphate aldolase